MNKPIDIQICFFFKQIPTSAPAHVSLVYLSRANQAIEKRAEVDSDNNENDIEKVIPKDLKRNIND